MVLLHVSSDTQSKADSEVGMMAYLSSLHPVCSSVQPLADRLSLQPSGLKCAKHGRWMGPLPTHAAAGLWHPAQWMMSLEAAAMCTNSLSGSTLDAPHKMCMLHNNCGQLGMCCCPCSALSCDFCHCVLQRMVQSHGSKRTWIMHDSCVPFLCLYRSSENMQVSTLAPLQHVLI